MKCTCFGSVVCVEAVGGPPAAAGVRTAWWHGRRRRRPFSATARWHGRRHRMVLGAANAAVATRPRVAGEHARIEGAGGQWHGASVASSWRGVCGGGEARHGGG